MKTIVGETITEIDSHSPEVDQRWYVVQSKPRQELLAATTIETCLQAPVYLPEILRPRQKQQQREPLFPGYLFVQSEPSHLLVNRLDRLAGVARLIRLGGQAQSVSADVIRTLMDRIAALNTAGGLPIHPFQPGDMVRLSSGPLAGLEAIFVQSLSGSERVQLLLHFLGREQTITASVNDLERAMARPPRRTRGHGRAIGNKV